MKNCLLKFIKNKFYCNVTDNKISKNKTALNLNINDVVSTHVFTILTMAVNQHQKLRNIFSPN